MASEQCSLCVSCPHVVKCFSCSFFGDQLLGVMFHINELKRGRAEIEMSVSVRASVWDHSGLHFR